MNSSLPRVVAILSLLFIGLSASLADTLTGEIRGRVVDAAGKLPLGGARVLLTNQSRGWQKEIRTSDSGEYLFIQLDPGNYSVRVELENYYPHERPNILVPLNRPKVVIPDIELPRRVSTPTGQITLRGEQTKIAIVDLTAPNPNAAVLAILQEPGATSLVSSLDGTLRFNFEADVIQALPLRGGRSFDQLALLAPGVFRVPFSDGEGPAVGIGVGTSGQFAVNGLRGRSNNFTVDGSDNNDEDIGVRRQGFVSLVPQSIESVQALQVITAGFPADSGRNAGSMVNAVSRSGEKAWHGTLYGIFNDDALNARNFFDLTFSDTVNRDGLSGGGASGEDFNQKQYGGVAGGPLVAEKLFVFGSAEQLRYHGTRLKHFTVPASGERGLRTKDRFVPIEELDAFLESRFINYSAQAGRGVFSLYPLPNHPTGPFGANTYSQVKRAEGSGSTASVKLDWLTSKRHLVFARYNFTDDRSLVPFTGEAIESSLATSTRTQNLSLFLNSTWERFGSALRFSYGRTRLDFPPERGSPLLFGSPREGRLPTAGAQAIETSYGRFGPYGATGAIGQLAILPYSPIGVDVFNFPQGRVDNTWQASEFVARTGGRLTLRAGADIRRSQLNSFAERNSRPLMLFGYGTVSGFAFTCGPNPDCFFPTEELRGTDLASFGAPAGVLQSLTTSADPSNRIGLRFTQYDLFAQADWKVRPNLLINAGLRYELQTVPSEVSSRIEETFNLSPAEFPRLAPTGSAANQAIIRSGNLAFDRALDALQTFVAGREKIYDGHHNRFAPRFGFAWDPTGQARMAIRGSYSLSYDANLGAVTSQSRNVFPSYVPVNLDLNFGYDARLTQGTFLNNPSFFTFVPTQSALVRPGTLNTYNLTGDAFATGLGTLFAQSVIIPGAVVSANGLAFTLPERRFRSSYAQHLVFSVERQFGESYLVSASYVGTQGRRLPRFSTPNAGLIASPVAFLSAVQPLAVLDLPPTLSATGLGRPKSGLGAFTLFEGNASSSFHSSQLSVEKRLSRGWQFRAHWTWSHAIDEASDPFDGRGFFSLPQDSNRPELERGSASFDVRHRVAAYVLWQPPDFRNHFLTRGWSAAAVVEIQGGQPFTVNSAVDRNRDGNLTDRLQTTAGLEVHPGEAHRIRLASGTAPRSLLASARASGLVGRNTFRADGIASVDLALSRKIVIAGSLSTEIRVEAFNLFNRTHLAIPVRILESPGFGHAFDTQVNPRTVRLSVKWSF